MTNTNMVEACTTYGTCLLLALQNIDWMVVGGVVLLIARLCKDVPDAYDAIVERVNRNKKVKRTKRVKGNRQKARRASR